MERMVRGCVHGLGETPHLQTLCCFLYEVLKEALLVPTSTHSSLEEYYYLLSPALLNVQIICMLR